MASGLGVTLHYLIRNETWLRSFFRVSMPVDPWIGVVPLSAGAFGVPLGFTVCGLVSLLAPAPLVAMRDFVQHLRRTDLPQDAPIP